MVAGGEGGDGGSAGGDSKRDHRGRPSDEVCDILQHILEACKAPFQGSPPSSGHYAPPIDSMPAFIPSLPKLVGPANYFADSAPSQPNRAYTVGLSLSY